jgi:hypothetical protein
MVAGLGKTVSVTWCAAVALLVVALAAAPAGSQVGPNPASPPPPPPPKLEPLPEVPPPPEIAGDAELEPQVTITRKDGETVEEARIDGRLIWIKVTPRHGRPYFLVPDAGGQLFLRRDSLDSGLRVPLWLLFTF